MPTHGSHRTKHDHKCENMMAVLNIVNGVAFTIGSLLFLPGVPIEGVRVGDLLFIFGSFLVFFFALMGVKEASIREVKFDEHDRNEFLETVMYAVSGVIFFFGSFFYFPGIYQNNKEAMIKGQIIGAIMFVIGSMGFTAASFFNAIGMASDKSELVDHHLSGKIHCFHVWAIFNSLFGSVLFVCGSMLYRVATRFCMEIEFASRRVDKRLDQACFETEVAGTSLYILGSLMFVIEAVLNYKCMHLKWQLEEEVFAGDRNRNYYPRISSNGTFLPPANPNGRPWIQTQNTSARSYASVPTSDNSDYEDDRCCGFE